MTKLTVIRPACQNQERTRRLGDVLEYALKGVDCRVIDDFEAFHDLQGQRILFAITQGASGINLESFRYLKRMRLKPDMLEDCVGGIIIDGDSELYTKSVGRDFVFTANRCGCTFPGRPLVEGTGSLLNFNIQAKNQDTDHMEAYCMAGKNLVERILEFHQIPKMRPKILLLHASNFKTSNTINFWEMMKPHLQGCDIREISLRNGSIQDCAGCPFKMCMHFSEQADCFYGGPIVDQVYPAVRTCDALVLLCPNYNDAISANIAAFINRLTALFRQKDFADKNLFAVIVSGYSGGDIVASQLISGLNMNKSFILPRRFAFMTTANDPGSIKAIEGIEEDAKKFAEHIVETVRG